MSYLIDTNVVTELMKSNREANVVSWVNRHESDCFLSAISIGEIERGLELLPISRKRLALQNGFRDFLYVIEDRVLAFDTQVARQWAKLTSTSKRSGRPAPVLDSMIEATALHWKLTVVTRNTSDFIQASTLSPWLGKS